MNSRISKRLRWATLSVALGIFWGCGGGEGGEDRKPGRVVTTVELSPDGAVLEEGKTLRLVVRAFDKEGEEVKAGLEPLFKAEPPSVATVDRDGLVTAMMPGSAKISVDVQGKTASVDLVVVDAIDSIEITPNPVEIFTKQSIQLKAEAFNEKGEVIEDVTFTWKVENTRVATVDDTGRLTALRREQETEVIAIARGVEGKAVVKVRKSVETLEITPSQPTLREKDTLDLKATVRDDGGEIMTGWEVSWSTSDPSIASIDREGKVLGVKPGEATIEATAGGVTDSVTVKVLPERVFSMEVEPKSFDLVVGQRAPLEVRTFNQAGEEIFDRAIQWSVRDTFANNKERAGLAADLTESGELEARLPFLGEFQLVVPGDGISATVPLRFVLRFQSVAAGRDHTCALTDDGEAWCWGANVHGELGRLPESGGDRLPRPVQTDIRFAYLSAGYRHTCGLALDGDAYCWGNNEFGQLGNDSVEASITPVPVVLPAGVERFEEIHAGDSYTCALDDVGAAYCWGWNFDGRLGVGSLDDSHVPIPVVGPEGEDPIAFQKISVGSNPVAGTKTLLTCGLSLDGVAYCWGENDDPSYGIGAGPLVLTSNRPVALDTELTFKDISVGRGHGCALDTSGSPHCWGGGSFGQLGDGQAILGHHRHSPHPVSTSTTYEKLFVGGDEACAQTADGSIECWGETPAPNVQNLTPTPVNWKATQLSKGELHTCGVDEEQVVQCWGFNSGRLGYPGPNYALEPIPLFPESEDLD